eukprot:828792-Karenia_brevis.AAC.1
MFRHMATLLPVPGIRNKFYVTKRLGLTDIVDSLLANIGFLFSTPAPYAWVRASLAKIPPPEKKK